VCSIFSSYGAGSGVVVGGILVAVGETLQAWTSHTRLANRHIRIQACFFQFMVFPPFSLS
jgi:hypothetical protein